jgi:N-acylneuraminate cytidylyltransferase
MEKTKNVAFIPARSGSKGVPGKNIKYIHGKPLIAWSIEQALAANCVDDVYVSTDCQQIKAIAEHWGAKVPFMRPPEISGDSATTESAVMHFINWASQNTLSFDYLTLMQATSPFRYSGQLDKAMKQFIREDADSMVTVTKTHRFIWKYPNNPQASYDVFNRPRRQEIRAEDEIYFENGSFYISKIEVYKKYNNRLGGKIAMFEMAPEESFEIDDVLDFELTEFMMKNHGIN